MVVCVVSCRVGQITLRISVRAPLIIDQAGTFFGCYRHGHRDSGYDQHCDYAVQQRLVTEIAIAVDTGAQQQNDDKPLHAIELIARSFTHI